MYFVEQKYFNSGNSKAHILTLNEAKALGYHDGYQKETATCDIWVDAVETLAEALQLVQDTLEA